MNGQQRYSPWGYGRQMPQGQGFYNPYMKSPDWGQGLQTLAQKLMMMRQMSEEREQREQQETRRQEEAAGRAEVREEQLRGIRGKEDIGLIQQGWRYKQLKAHPELEQYWPPYTTLTPKQIQDIIGPEEIKPKVAPVSVIERILKRYKADKTWWDNLPTKEKGRYITEDITISKEERKPAPETQEEKEKHIKKEAEIRAEVTARYRVKPTAKPEPTPEETRQKGATTRNALQKRVSNFYKSLGSMVEKGRIKAKELKKIIKKQGGGRPVSQQGYALDMPEKYNRAVLNQRNGVALPEDMDIIEKYDALFGRFQDTYLPDFPTFNDWMRSEYPSKKGMDRNQVKIWYEIYGMK